MKTGQVRAKLSGDNLEFVRQWAELSHLQQVDIASMLLNAAVTACRNEGEQFRFPVQFKTVEPQQVGKVRYPLNEPPPPPYGKKK